MSPTRPDGSSRAGAPRPYALIGPGAGAQAVLQDIHAALDRADDLRADPTALAAAWAAARVLVLDAEGLAHGDADGAVLLRGDALGAFDADAWFLGRDAMGRAWFARIEAAADDDGVVPRIDLRSAAAGWPALQAGAFACARALQAWHARTRFCGVCGGATRVERAGWLLRCTACAAEHYPRTDSAVIAAVSDGERLLLGRQATWPARRWSLVAGFVEPGESFEQAVAREVAEETGVRVTAARYRASQPWPFPGSLMIGFDADALPDSPRASDELEDARWFTLEDLVQAQARDVDDDGAGIRLSPRLSIARWLIDEWIQARAARASGKDA